MSSPSISSERTNMPRHDRELSDIHQKWRVKIEESESTRRDELAEVYAERVVKQMLNCSKAQLAKQCRSYVVCELQIPGQLDASHRKVKQGGKDKAYLQRLQNDYREDLGIRIGRRAVAILSSIVEGHHANCDIAYIPAHCTSSKISTSKLRSTLQWSLHVGTLGRLRSTAQSRYENWGNDSLYRSFVPLSARPSELREKDFPGSVEVHFQVEHCAAFRESLRKKFDTWLENNRSVTWLHPMG